MMSTKFVRLCKATLHFTQEVVIVILMIVLLGRVLSADWLLKAVTSLGFVKDCGMSVMYAVMMTVTFLIPSTIQLLPLFKYSSNFTIWFNRVFISVTGAHHLPLLYLPLLVVHITSYTNYSTLFGVVYILSILHSKFFMECLSTCTKQT